MEGAITVVIPVRNDAAALPAAVASALDQAHVGEVLLCVGPSSDDTLAVAEELAAGHGRVRVLLNEHGGIPQALNLGLGNARGRYLLRLDAHSVLPPGYAHAALDAATVLGCANVGAVQMPVGETHVERAIAAAMRHRFGSGGAAYRGGSQRRVVDTAFLGFYDVEALRGLGGWDERFDRNEDAELNLRLAAAGHEVWLDPALVVAYRPRGSLRALARQYFDYGTWRFRTVRKHPGSLRLRQMAAPLIVVALAGSVVAAWVRPLALGVPAAYAASVMVVGLGSEGPASQRLLTAAALPTMHLSWGSGFLLSAVRSPFGRAQRGST